MHECTSSFQYFLIFALWSELWRDLCSFEALSLLDRALLSFILLSIFYQTWKLPKPWLNNDPSHFSSVEISGAILFWGSPGPPPWTNLTQSEVSVLSESMLIIFIGFVLGLILPTRGGSVIAWAVGAVGVEEEGLAMAGVLNLFLLPIIIFEAGWSMNHRAFVDLLLPGINTTHSFLFVWQCYARSM